MALHVRARRANSPMLDVLKPPGFETRHDRLFRCIEYQSTARAFPDRFDPKVFHPLNPTNDGTLRFWHRAIRSS